MLKSGDALRLLLDCVVENYPNDLDGYAFVPFGASLVSCCTENGFLGLSEVSMFPSKKATPSLIATGAQSDNAQQFTVNGLLRFAQCASVSPDGNFIYDNEVEWQKEANNSNRRSELYSALICCLKPHVVEFEGENHTLGGGILEPMYNVEVSGGCTIAEYPFYLEACKNGCQATI